MSELEKARHIEAPDAVRAKAMDLLSTQIRAWAIALPSVTPLVLDFGLRQFESIGLTEIWIANEVASGYCGKYLFVSDGQTCGTQGRLPPQGRTSDVARRRGGPRRSRAPLAGH